MQVLQQSTALKDKEEQFTRPPVVVLLGHVDHGKTTLLDTIAGSKFTAEEFGEITQNIRAAEVETKHGKMTFIDTPGHSYFHNFRNYGVKFADIALLVVSAAEGVKEQTLESIKLAKEAAIPVICVVSKTDLPKADTQTVTKQLAEAGVLTEGKGGAIPVVEVSATKGTGIDNLIETISILAAISEFKANLEAKSKGVILESFLDKKAGPVALVITKDGILAKGAKIKIDGILAKVRAIFSQDGKLLDKVFPGQPVKILGISKLVSAGNLLTEEDDGEVTTTGQTTAKRITLSDREKAKRQLAIILKTDTAGSKEAVLANLPKEVAVLDAGVGPVTASDVEKVVATGARIFGFNVDTTPDAKILLKNSKNLFFQSPLIYELIDEIKKASLTHYKKEEKFQGTAKVVKVFDLGSLKIAGCKVTEGLFKTGGKVKVFRADYEIGEAEIGSIKQFSKTIEKVSLGSECGIGFLQAVDFQVGDVLKFVS